MYKFKIDIDYREYLVSRLEYKTIFSEKWQSIKAFSTIEEAREFIEKIKDLPEYH